MNNLCGLGVVVLACAEFSLGAASINWTNSSGGYWNAAANWSPNQVPGASDTAIIANAGTFTVTVNTAVTVAGLEVGGASGTQTLALTAQTLTLNGACTVNTQGAFSMSGGTLAGTGDLTINGTLTWSGGAISGSGNITANGATALSGTTKTLTGRNFLNAGQLTWTAGRWDQQPNTVITNLPGATFEIVGDQNLFNSGGGSATFGNAGLLRKSTGSATTTFNRAFVNTGTLDLQSGTISLDANGTNAGTMTLSAGSTLLFAQSYTLTEGSSLTGAGGVIFAAGTVVVDGTDDTTGTNLLQSGTLIVPSGLSVSTMTIIGGVLNITNSLRVSGLLTWSGGQITGSGSVWANGGVVLDGTTKTLTGCNFINAGQLTWTAGRWDQQPNTVITNLPGATFEIAGDLQVFNSGGGSAAIGNAGLLRKTAGSGEATLNRALVNNGTVEVQSGTLTLAGNGTNNGTITVPAGSALHFTQSYTLASESSLTGAGAVIFDSGTVVVDGTYNITGTNVFDGSTVSFIGNYALDGRPFALQSGSVTVNKSLSVPTMTITTGTLSITNSLTVSGVFTWSGGQIIGTGDILASGEVVLDGTTRTLTGCNFINAGQLTWTAGRWDQQPNTVITNLPGATFDIAGDLTVFNSGGGNGSIGNGGLLRKTAGSGTATLSRDFVDTGTVEVQSGLLHFSRPVIQWDGATRLNGGDLDCDLALRIEGGALTGAGTITGNVTNNGAVSPGASPGLLMISGTYTQTTNGSLNLELAGPPESTNYSRLVVGSKATLDGNLKVTLTNGFYPAPRVTFTNVVRAVTLSGTFASFNYPSNAVTLQIAYGTTNVNIQVLNTAPILPVISDQTLDELTLLSFNVNATDADAPAQTLTYSLTNSPPTATISSSGQVSWMPSEIDGPTTTNIAVVVTDSGTPPLTTSQTFQVTVREINTAPVLNVPPSQAIDEETTFTANVTATDSDIPANSLTLELLSGPSGLTMSPEGTISWTPSEAQGPGSYGVTVRVTDNNPDASNAQQLSTTNSFVLTVNEVNTAPVLGGLRDHTVNSGEMIAFTATATDVDVPTNTLAFTLLSPFPGGATIDAASGQFSWRPTVAQAGSTNLVRIRVADNGSPSLSDTNSFTVIVNPMAPVILTPVSFINGQFTCQVSGPVGPDYVLQASSTLTDWTNLATNTPTAMPFEATDSDAGASGFRFYRVLLQP